MICGLITLFFIPFLTFHCQKDQWQNSSNTGAWNELRMETPCHPVLTFTISLPALRKHFIAY
jgi:hypothetical protein